MKALIIVDAQYDFMKDGALEVPNANEIIPIINKLQEQFEMVVFTQDWHPNDHKSFASNHEGKKIHEVIDLHGNEQVLWPDHCVQNSHGAKIHKDIKQKEKAHYIKKGQDTEVDSYSGFFDNNREHDTGLNDLLKSNKVKTVYVCGLATDFCVKFTALDAADLDYETYLITDATKAVNIAPGDYDKALKHMQKADVKLIESKELL